MHNSTNQVYGRRRLKIGGIVFSLTPTYKYHSAPYHVISRLFLGWRDVAQGGLALRRRA